FLGVKVFTRPDDNIATLVVDECLNTIYLTLATLETTINGCGRITMRPQPKFLSSQEWQESGRLCLDTHLPIVWRYYHPVS
ncbi:MAG: hypothetical protein Q8L01_03245, partial [Candidatus Woesebacteria bacterium]|nr:hypothetical protein [Candidatus Woesebacteria bacterium]